MVWWALGSAWSQLPGTAKLSLKGVQEQPPALQSQQQTVLARLEQQGEERREVGTRSGSLGLVDGGAEHDRSAWEISGDAIRLQLRRFCDRGYNQQSVRSLTSPTFTFARCQLCSAIVHW